MNRGLVLGIIATFVASLSLSMPNVSALGSHNGGSTPTPIAATTTVTPGYCNFGSSGANDSTESFTNLTVGSGPHAQHLLALSLTSTKNGNAIPYGLVQNSANPIFSSLAFDATTDASSPNFGVAVEVANNDGFLDEGAVYFNGMKSTALATTPPGFTHCLVTPTNLDFEPGPVDQTATFVFAEIAINTNKSNNATIVNVNLNNSSTFATAVLATPANNCFTPGI